MQKHTQENPSLFQKFIIMILTFIISIVIIFIFFIFIVPVIFSNDLQLFFFFPLFIPFWILCILRGIIIIVRRVSRWVTKRVIGANDTNSSNL
jgi:hypothetical protein